MDDKAVEAKLERIYAHATIALELITYGFKDKDLVTMRRHLGHILAASRPYAARNLNHIPDPMDRGDEEKEAAKEPDGSEGHDYDAMGNEAGMDDTYVPGPPTPGCPF